MRRVWILVAAIAAGCAAAVLVALFLASAGGPAAGAGQTVAVLVATKALPKGSPVGALLADKSIDVRQIPKAYAAADIVPMDKSLDDRVLTSDLAPGDQLTARSVQARDQAGLAHTLTGGQVAVSVAYDDARSVSGLLKTGDDVIVVATLQAADGTYSTHVLLPKAKVVAVGTTVSEPSKGQQQAGSGTQAAADSSPPAALKTVTLGVQPTDVERLVFAQERGKIWLALYGTGSQGLARAAGETVDTVFR